MRERIAAFFLIFLLATSAWSRTETQRIDEVVVTGNVRSDVKAVLRLIRTQAGDRIDRKTIRDDLKRVFALGYYEDVKLVLKRNNDQTVLVVQLTEKPSVRKIVYRGHDELSEETIAEVVDIKPYSILNASKLTATAEKIKDLYIEKGYFLAEIDWRLEPAPKNQVDVVFKIAEKDEVTVESIRIVTKDAHSGTLGIPELSDEFIKSRLETREGGGVTGVFTSGGPFKSDALERDISRLGHHFWNLGYVKAKVGNPTIELTPDRRRIHVTVTVSLGKRYRTGTVDIDGDLLEEKSVLMKKVKLVEGEWFSTGQVRESIEGLGNVYKDKGYAYANISPNTLIDENNDSVDVTFQISRGNKVRIGRIEITGNTRTRDKVIRRELRIYEGEFFSGTALKRSERLVNRLGYFEPGSVRFTTKRGADAQTMDVTIEVKEKATGSFQIGAGFSTVENFVAQAQISQNNLFGRGQSLTFRGNFSSIRNIVNVNFFEPYLLDTRINFGVDLYRFENVLTDFTRESLGGRLTLGYPLTDDWGIASTYTLEEVSLQSGGYLTSQGDPSTRLAIYGQGVTSSIRLSLNYDTRNNRLFPTGGSFASGSVENAPRFLGSDNEFTRYRLNGRYYYGLGMGVVAKVRADYGLIFSHTSDEVPLYERFFVGGPLSVRGFNRNTLSPTLGIVNGGTPYGTTYRINEGGTEQLVMNGEIEYPIFQPVNVRGVFFLDAGNAFGYEEPVSEKLGTLRYAWGFGVRWLSPMGPLRFEWGFPFNPKQNEPGSVFEFSIGNFF